MQDPAAPRSISFPRPSSAAPAGARPPSAAGLPAGVVALLPRKAGPTRGCEDLCIDECIMCGAEMSCEVPGLPEPMDPTDSECEYEARDDERVCSDRCADEWIREFKAQMREDDYWRSWRP